MASEKDTIYVDIDDEITAIIDKVRGSDGKIIALVLPKRAAVFQSIVNMKLLKRAADADKKHLVLVTTEANLMPLAGMVGLHVAATPQSKPEIPAAAQPVSDEESMDEPVEEAAFTAENAGDEPVGELAAKSGHVVSGTAVDAAVTLDDEVSDEDTVDTAKMRKNRHLKVPNFDKFRLRLFLAVLGIVALIAGLYVANVVLPRATIAITTNSSTLNVSIQPTLDTGAQALDATKLIVPATSEQQQKTLTKQVDATGQKNKGDKATGTVTMTAVKCTGNPFIVPDPVPAGSGLSNNGLTFITQETATFHGTGTSGGCFTYAASGSIDITAQTGGSKYNVSGVDFTVAGRSDASANGSASGGTDDVVKVVSQEDIDNAKQKLTDQDTSSVQTALEDALKADGVYPLTATFKAGKTKVSTDKNVGDEADNVTVTESITYTMFGVKQADLDTLIKANIATQIDINNQVILNDGLDAATVTVTSASGSKMQITLQTAATIGPQIDAAKIKQQAAGKRIGDVKSMINALSGVQSVDVQLSPFWVSTVPTNPHQVTVTIDKGH